MGRIHVGVAHPGDRSLIARGRFYPPGLRSSSRRLAHYATRFATAEMAVGFHGPLDERTCRAWIEMTPDGFLAHPRAYSMLTRHPTSVPDLPEVLLSELPRDYLQRRQSEVFPAELVEAAFDMFYTSVKPLMKAGRLGCVLFCFPPWFTAGRHAFHWLELVGEKAAGVPTAVEFCHESWIRNPGHAWATDLLKQAGLGFVASDAPWIPQGEGPGALTAPFAYVRLSGRNMKSWRQPGLPRSRRLRYGYTGRDLAGWAVRVRRVSMRAAATFVLFNNAPGWRAVEDAAMFRGLLRDGDRKRDGAVPEDR
ncbi:MAG: DUF72 domain-containing protein [Desulfatibacillaceae bacterium]